MNDKTKTPVSSYFWTTKAHRINLQYTLMIYWWLYPLSHTLCNMSEDSSYLRTDKVKNVIKPHPNENLNVWSLRETNSNSERSYIYHTSTFINETPVRWTMHFELFTKLCPSFVWSELVKPEQKDLMNLSSDHHIFVNLTVSLLHNKVQ